MPVNNRSKHLSSLARVVVVASDPSRHLSISYPCLSTHLHPHPSTGDHVPSLSIPSDLEVVHLLLYLCCHHRLRPHLLYLLTPTLTLLIGLWVSFAIIVHQELSI